MASRDFHRKSPFNVSLGKPRGEGIAHQNFMLVISTPKRCEVVEPTILRHILSRPSLTHTTYYRVVTRGQKLSNK